MSYALLGAAIGWLFSNLVLTPPITEDDGWVVLIFLIGAVVANYLENKEK